MTALIVDRLGDSWNEMLGQLVAYKGRHGHTDVPYRHRHGSEHIKLGHWVNQQRFIRRKGKLAPDCIKRLDELGFVWDPIAAKWKEMFAALLVFKDKHGHCNVSTLFAENPVLGRWVSTQRQERQKGRLLSSRVRLLEDNGFDWNPGATAWKEMIQKLEAYKDENGNCNVPATWEDDQALAQWVTRQRGLHRNGGLEADRVERLEQLEFEWESSKYSWEKMYNDLVEVKARNKHPNVSRTDPKTLQLANWLGHQRQYARKGKLSKRQLQLLEEIGSLLNSKESKWEDNFQLLKAYHEKHGNCDVPARYPDNPSCGSWVARQRRQKQFGRLASQRIKRLDAIGLNWSPKDNQWENMFSELEKFQLSHGNCDVRPSNCTNFTLVSWVKNQRTVRNAGRMYAERQNRLNGLGFIWNTKDHQWDQMYDSLRKFEAQKGHCDVALSDDKKLGIWVSNQRANRRRDKLRPERIKRLNDLGFRW